MRTNPSYERSNLSFQNQRLKSSLSNRGDFYYPAGAGFSSTFNFMEPEIPSKPSRSYQNAMSSTTAILLSANSERARQRQGQRERIMESRGQQASGSGVWGRQRSPQRSKTSCTVGGPAARMGGSTQAAEATFMAARCS